MVYYRSVVRDETYHPTEQCSTTLHSKLTTAFCTSCSALYGTALHCAALNCAALHCTALHCTALGVSLISTIHFNLYCGDLTPLQLQKGKILYRTKIKYFYFHWHIWLHVHLSVSAMERRKAKKNKSGKIL